MRRANPLLFIFIALFLACQEEKDEVLPEVAVLLPTDNSVFKVLDTVLIQATVRDNEKIEQVLVQLEELGSGRKVGKTLTFNPNGRSFDLNTLYVIEDSLLNSGDYFFRVQASDGENQNAAFATISLQGIAKRTLGVYLLLDEGNRREIAELDQNNQFSTLFPAGQSRELVFNSRAQLLWWADRNTQQMQAFQVKDQQLFSPFFPNGGNVADPIQLIRGVGDLTYVATANGFMQAYNGTLADVFTYQSPSNFKVDRIYPLGNRIMIQESDRLDQNQRFLYLFSNGAIESRSSSNQEVIGFGTAQQAGSAFQFIKEGSQMQVRAYDLNLGNSSFFLQKMNFDYQRLIQIDAFNYLFYNQSEVVTYNLSTNFRNTLASGLTDPVVAYNPADRTVYVGSGTELSVFDQVQGNLISTISVPYPIVDIAIRYNK